VQIEHRTSRPFLLIVGTGVAGFLAAVFALCAIGGLLGAGSFTWGGSAPLAGIARFGAIAAFAVASAWLALIAYGYATQQRWARPLGPLFWLVATCLGAAAAVIGSADPIGDWLAVGGLAFATLIAVWYFYRKRAVVDYYTMLIRSSSSEDSSRAGA